MAKKQTRFNPNKENSIFATRLRELFTKQKKSQKNLADYIKENGQKEYSRQMVSNWTHGCEPNLTTIPIIANFFGVSTDYLLGKSDVQSANTDLKGVCDYTNLSEGAIKQITDLKNSQDAKASGSSLFELFDYILNKGIITELLELMQNYINNIPELRTISKEEHQQLLSKCNPKDRAKLRSDLLRDYKNSSDFILWQASKDFETILHNLEREVNENLKGDQNNGNS